MMRQGVTGQEKWARASLRVFSDTLQASDITTLLGMEPSRSYFKGQPVSSRNPKTLRRKSAWIFKSGLEQDPDLAAHLRRLLDFIEPRLDRLDTLRETCRVDLFCGFASESGQGGTTLDSALLARLGRLRLDLTMDLYPPASIEPDDE
jgi:hypothetical protein